MSTIQWIMTLLSILGGGGILGWLVLYFGWWKNRTRVTVVAYFESVRVSPLIHILGDPYPDHRQLYVVIRVLLLSGGPVVLTACKAVVANHEHIDLELIKSPKPLEPKIPLELRTGDLGFLTVKWGMKDLYVQGTLPKERWRISRKNLRQLQTEFPERLKAIREHNESDEDRMRRELHQQQLQGNEGWTRID